MCVTGSHSGEESLDQSQAINVYIQLVPRAKQTNGSKLKKKPNGCPAAGMCCTINERYAYNRTKRGNTHFKHHFPLIPACSQPLLSERAALTPGYWHQTLYQPFCHRLHSTREPRHRIIHSGQKGDRACMSRLLLLRCCVKSGAAAACCQRQHKGFILLAIATVNANSHMRLTGGCELLICPFSGIFLKKTCCFFLWGLMKIQEEDIEKVHFNISDAILKDVTDSICEQNSYYLNEIVESVTLIDLINEGHSVHHLHPASFKQIVYRINGKCLHITTNIFV